MALRFHNDHILTSLRVAYSNKHCDDSLLLNEGRDLITRRETADIEADLAELSLRLHSDPNYEGGTIKSQSSNSLNVQTVLSGTHSTDEEDRAYGRSPSTQSSSAQVSTQGSTNEYSQDTAHASSVGAPSAHWSMADQLQAPQPGLVPKFADDSASTGGGDLTAAPSDPAANLLQISHSFAQAKDFGLDIEDDSDFEDNILQATQEIKFQVHPPARRSSSIRTSSGRLSSPLKSTFETPELFAKRDVTEAPAQPTASSQLTSKLAVTQRDPREQYMEAVTGLQTTGVTGIRFTIHMAGHEPLTITVKQDCSTHLAIGYALYKSDVTPGDANMYNLRLAEDDGEPDEDFPALDRTRPLVSYHVDEFAIVKATESEFRENSKRTPNKISFKSASSSGKSALGMNANAAASTSTLMPFLIPDTPPGPVTYTDAYDPTEMRKLQQQSKQDAGQTNGEATENGARPGMYQQQSQEQQQQHIQQQQPQEQQSLLPELRLQTQQEQQQQPQQQQLQQPQQPSQQQLQRQQVQQPGLLRAQAADMNLYSSSLSGSKFEAVAVRIFMYPYDPILSPVFWADEVVPRQSQLKEVFHQMCRDKMMDSDMYVLRAADPSHRIINLNSILSGLIPAPTATVQTSSLPAESAPEDAMSVNFEVIALRNLPPSQAARPRSASRTGGDAQPVSPRSKAKRKPSNDILQNTVLAMQPLGFYKYPVLRRQQMNFLGRSERELVIDGEYIHIMPPTDWSLLDQPKTTTFHIRQVIQVKQSRKISTNFSIIVMKASGPKRYDLESADTATTIEIVDRLQRLKVARSKSIGV